VKSSCFNTEDAAGLPKAVFVCDVKEEEEEPVQENIKQIQPDFETILSEKLGKTSDECKAEHGDQNSCDADSSCTWCVSRAVKSSCFNTEDAAGLPKAVFVCDVKEEDENEIFSGAMEKAE